MSSVEAAASLFGPGDVTSDPFGSIGGNDEANPENTTYPSNGHRDPHSAADVFDTNGWETQGYDGSQLEEPATHASYSWSGDSGSNGYATSHNYQESTGEDSTYYSQQGYSSVDSHWSASQYGEYAQQPQTSYEPTVNHVSYESSTIHAPVDGQHSAYAPAVHTQADTFSANGASEYPGHAQSVYDPYKPGPQAAPQRATPSASPSNSHYQPYQPLVNSPPVAQYGVAPPVATTARSSAAQSFYTGMDSTAKIPVPPQPEPVAALFRPKTSNAYDPPLPPPKPSRAFSSSASTRTMSPSIGQQTYPSQNHIPRPRSTAGASPYTSAAASHAPVPPPPKSPRSAHNSYAGLPPSGLKAPPPVPPIPAQYQPVAPPLASPPLRAPPPPALPIQQSPYYATSPGVPYGSFGAADNLSSTSDYHAHSNGNSNFLEGSGSQFEQPPVQAEDHYHNDTHDYEGTFTASIYDQSTAHGLESSNFHDSESASHAPAAEANADIFDLEGDATFIAEDGPAPSLHTVLEDDFPPASPPRAPERTVPPPSRYDLYQPNGSAVSGSPPSVLARTKSPSGSSTRGSDRGSFDLQRSGSSDVVASLPPPPPVSSYVSGPYQPPATMSFDPKPHVSRVSSPSSIRSWKSPRVPAHDPYAPDPSGARERSMSNASVYSTQSSTAVDPYTSRRLRQTPSEPSSSFTSPRVESNGAPAQTLSFSAPTHPPYAPSPSLLGTNDPLGRTGSRAPVMSFGFGGKFVTCCHGATTLNTGFDVALSSRQTTSIQVRLLHTVIPESALDTSSTPFPGPLFSDPGSPVTGLVRPGASTQTKNNKARVIKYMEERVDELSRGTSYLTQGSPERRQVEGKLVILKLLKVMVENDGLLSGSPKVESCVRSALVPRLNDSGNTTSTNGPIATSSYTVPGLDSLASTSEIGYPTLGLPVSDSQDSILSTTTVKASVLDKIQEFLMRGDRRKAYHYALDERLWAHALVIASSVDKEAWKEAVNEFIQAEVGSKGIANLSVGLRGKEPSTVSGREALTVAYGLYSGQGAAAIQALIPKSLGMPKMGDTLQVAPKPHLTPMSPNFAAPSAPIPAETLVHWPETAAMIIPGPSIAECSAALMALGDALLVNQWVEAAHACYLLAPQTAVLGGIGTPSARMVLVGALSPFKSPNFHVDHDAIIFSEIAEFANSLTTPAKGQEPFSGFPHLQAYKFIRATGLAELGHVQAANRYCEAISTSLNRSATYVSPDFLEQLKELSDRLIGAPQLDKSGSWIGGKMSRPSLDSLGNWLEGRFTKFIAGDGETTPEPNGHTNAVNESKSVNGPFAHYSTISSTTTSTAPSPQPTVINHNLLTDAQPNYPRRSGSAQAMRPAGNAQTQIDRASSAMEYRAFPRNSPPVPHGHPSKGYSATDYSPAGPYGYGYPPTETHPVQGTRDGAQGKAAISDANGSASNGNTWWGSSYGDDANVTTPTAATFHHVGQPPSSSGFISLMDDPTMHAPPTSEPPVSSSKLPAHDEEDDEDLGLGNSTRRRKSTDESSATSSTAKDTSSAPKASESAAPTRPDMKSTQQSSWFSRWWSRENTPGPVKATLGEESSFYYDKELKRWVNKKGGADASQPATPPPPPARAQTASPGRSAPRLPNGTSPAPPPARSASAMDMSGPPRRASAAAARPRSNLVPVNGETNGDSSPPGVTPTPTPPPGPSGTPPPPPSRPRSQAAKRNIRSRYVDVFQQPEA